MHISWGYFSMGKQFTGVYRPVLRSVTWECTGQCYEVLHGGGGLKNVKQ